jgi:hypothetical protein
MYALIFSRIDLEKDIKAIELCLNESYVSQFELGIET